MRYELQKTLRLLFQRTSIERILMLQEEKKIYYDDIDPRYLQDLMLTYSHEFSDTERRLQIIEIQNQLDDTRRDLISAQNPGKMNVFSVLFMHAPEILTFYENQVVCRYNRILEWNEITRGIGEDLLVLSMIVARDLRQGTICQNFCWSPVIGHNNTQLNKILKQGMADNHFHLRGSSPHFYISWIELMNNPGRGDVLKSLDRLEESCRDKNKKSEVLIRRQPLRVLAAEAALIRYYLCCRIKNLPFNLFDGNDSSTGNDAIEQVKRLLAFPYQLESNILELQTAIDSISAGDETEDYAGLFACSQYLESEAEYRILSGERWFIYSMLKELRISKHGILRGEFNWFYAYLRIKNEIRAELVQVNELVGFENFQVYQSRKDWFSHTGNWQAAEGRLARMAVRSVLNNAAIRFLEVRISPGKTAAENARNIQGYDEAIIQAYYKEDQIAAQVQAIFHNDHSEFFRRKFSDDDLRNRFCYILHFTKMADEPVSDIEMMECRHYQYRRTIKNMADEILRFRRDYPQYGRRVVGIDACAQEIGCRPEVYGRVFRMLKNYSYLSDDFVLGCMLPQLKVTYHVGEDFLDLVDGLRAIDEAIRFLDMDCGDRLGHALALGVDAKGWYSFKNKQITISLQDYLDNIVWMHHSLVRYKIQEVNSLKGWLEEQYSRYFTYIYQNSLMELLNAEGQVQNLLGRFDINTYFLAWLLRGDQPSLYKPGKFDEDKYKLNDWDHYAVNSKFRVERNDIRHIPEVALLYHMYHYSRQARRNGRETKTIHVPDNYITGAALIQKAMREDVVSRGIGIETNPSSNVRISYLSGFNQHPIKNLYNSGLTKNEKELMECPQINVSINTDDQGIFSTKLENEYALLACALEQDTNPDGSLRYKKEFIYEWLNNIRKMGLRQSFVSDVQDNV